MGVAVAALCCLGFWRGQWCLTETKKGRRLVDAFGAARALFLWRMILLLGVGFGVALAMGVINPVSWD